MVVASSIAPDEHMVHDAMQGGKHGRKSQETLGPAKNWPVIIALNRQLCHLNLVDIILIH